MVLLPVNIQFWPGAIKIIRFPSSFIMLLKKSYSVSFKEVKGLPLVLLFFFFFLTFSAVQNMYDLLLLKKRSRKRGTFLKWITRAGLVTNFPGY